MKLGYINYLNCYPFYYHMFEKEPLAGIDVMPGYPSYLNRNMREGNFDMSPVSAATCEDIWKTVYILPDFCLSSVGYVHSVILVSKLPIEELHRKKVGITSASHTSVVLLKILIEKYFNIRPVYVPSEPIPDFTDLDAALLIGNEAMVFEPEPEDFVYDLGELWLKKTTYPVVFAVFTVLKKSIETHEKEIKTVIDSYRKSLNCLKEEKERLIFHAKQKYPDIPYDIETYFNLLKFDFSPRLKEALNFYLKTAGDLGFIKKIDKLEYLDI